MGSIEVWWSAGHTYSYIPLSRPESEIPGCTRSLHAHQHWSSSNSSTVQGAAILRPTAPRQFKGTTTFECSGGAKERRVLMHKLMATGAEATIDTFHRGRVRSGAHSRAGDGRKNMTEAERGCSQRQRASLKKYIACRTTRKL